MNYLNCKRWKG